ncbi:MAG: hypothetical protein IJZ03_09325, partial [Clostridia bacterium]|nr:hypothetical protein [Clostridia bacterium]
RVPRAEPLAESRARKKAMPEKGIAIVSAWLFLFPSRQSPGARLLFSGARCCFYSTLLLFYHTIARLSIEELYFLHFKLKNIDKNTDMWHNYGKSSNAAGRRKFYGSERENGA